MKRKIKYFRTGILLCNRAAQLVSWLVDRMTQKLIIGSPCDFDMSFIIIKVRSSLQYSLIGPKIKMHIGWYQR